MSQAFFYRERGNIRFCTTFGVSQGLVDEKELNAFSRIVFLDCLQTGDVAQEWRSGQTAETQDGVTAFQRSGIKFFPLIVEDLDPGDW